MNDGAGDLAASEAAIARITTGINKALAELRELGMVGSASAGRGFSDIALSGVETGHDGLTSAFTTFCERWEWGVRGLIREANEFAEDVGLAAGAQFEAERYVHGSFKVLVNAGIGNPYASEDEIIAKDWGEVLAENPYNHVRDADYSDESSARADRAVEEIWRETVREVADSPVLPVPRLADAVGLGGELDDLVDRADPPSAPERAGEP
ncbi:hypothetical protein ABZ714_21520 [Streptomyces sp. NPDC006798]|uniref:hypothetical protein n=1 Tax=Streptomyces sp. NPDC006798 TaxID=3155462 RepID=UPI0033EA24E5